MSSTPLPICSTQFSGIDFLPSTMVHSWISFCINILCYTLWSCIDVFPWALTSTKETRVVVLVMSAVRSIPRWYSSVAETITGFAFHFLQESELGSLLGPSFSTPIFMLPLSMIIHGAKIILHALNNLTTSTSVANWRKANSFEVFISRKASMGKKLITLTVVVLSHMTFAVIVLYGRQFGLQSRRPEHRVDTQECSRDGAATMDHLRLHGPLHPAVHCHQCVSYTREFDVNLDDVLTRARLVQAHLAVCSRILGVGSCIRKHF